MLVLCFFFFNDTATTEIYTLSLHDALPISAARHLGPGREDGPLEAVGVEERYDTAIRRQRHLPLRSEEHTSELQSQSKIVCRLLLEKKKKEPHQRATLLSHDVTSSAANT